MRLLLGLVVAQILSLWVGSAFASSCDDKIEVRNLEAAPPWDLYILRPSRLSDPQYFEKTRVDLVEGQGVPVCEAYEQYLEHMTYPGDRGAQCYRWWLKSHAGIERPVVEIPALEDAWPLFSMIASYKLYGPAERRSERESQFVRDALPHQRELFEGGRYGLWRLLGVDLDNDGREDDLVVYRDQSCTDLAASSGGSHSLLPIVLRGQGGEIDYERTKLVLSGRTSWKGSESPSSNVHPLGAMTFSVFTYEGDTYLDEAVHRKIGRWDDEQLRTGAPLRVFRVEGGARLPVCEYRIQYSDKIAR